MSTQSKWLSGHTFSIISEKWLARIVGLVLGLATWYLIKAVFPMDLFPGPIQTAGAAYKLIASGIIWPHMGATFFRTFLGFVGAAVIGIAFGVVMGINNFGQYFSTPIILIALSIPGIAWAAIMTIILGFSIAAPVIATAVTVFPYISLRVWKGVETLNVDRIAMSQAFDISRKRLFRRMILPSIAPALFTAGRFGLAISWKVETQAELFGSSTGVGYRAVDMFSRYQYDTAMAWAAVFVVIVFALEMLVLRPLERRVYEYRSEIDFDTL